MRLPTLRMVIREWSWDLDVELEALLVFLEYQAEEGRKDSVSDTARASPLYRTRAARLSHLPARPRTNFSQCDDRS